MRTYKVLFLAIIALFVFNGQSIAQESVARQWNEALLNGIRNDFARPTVHARNLFHSSVAMYDAWAIYDEIAQPFLLGHTVGGYACIFNGIPATRRCESREGGNHKLCDVQADETPFL